MKKSTSLNPSVLDSLADDLEDPAKFNENLDKSIAEAFVDDADMQRAADLQKAEQQSGRHVNFGSLEKASASKSGNSSRVSSPKGNLPSLSNLNPFIIGSLSDNPPGDNKKPEKEDSKPSAVPKATPTQAKATPLAKEATTASTTQKAAVASASVKAGSTAVGSAAVSGAKVSAPVSQQKKSSALNTASAAAVGTSATASRVSRVTHPVSTTGAKEGTPKATGAKNPKTPGSRSTRTTPATTRSRSASTPTSATSNKTGPKRRAANSVTPRPSKRSKKK